MGGEVPSDEALGAGEFGLVTALEERGEAGSCVKRWIAGEGAMIGSSRSQAVDSGCAPETVI